MKSVIVSERINAPVHRVFALFTDLKQMADCVEGIDHAEVLTDGPMQVGTRWRETRTLFGKQATEEMEISEFELDHHFTSVAESCGSRYRSTFRFTPEGEATQVTREFAATPVGLMAKLMSPLFGFMTKSVAKCMREDLADLKRVAESAPQGTTTEPSV